MGDLIGFLLWSVFELLFVFTGRLVIGFASGGRWRAERMQAKESRIHGPSGALSFKRDGERVFTTAGLGIVGLSFYGLLALALFWGVS